MISNKELDGFLTLTKHHNIVKNHAFNTIWIGDVNADKIKEIAFTLESFGYITIENQKLRSDEKFHVWITESGMKFLQEGGFVALEKIKKEQKRKKRLGIIYTVLGIIAALLTIISVLILII